MEDHENTRVPPELMQYDIITVFYAKYIVFIYRSLQNIDSRDLKDCVACASSIDKIDFMRLWGGELVTVRTSADCCIAHRSLRLDFRKPCQLSNYAVDVKV